MAGGGAPVVTMVAGVILEEKKVEGGLGYGYDLGFSVGLMTEANKHHIDRMALRAWFQRFSGYPQRIGFHQSRCHTSLFIYHQGSDTAYLLLYVDDIVLTASSTGLVQAIIASLHKEFAMTDLGPLNYFFGIHATRTASGMFLSQKQYASEIIEWAGMLSCHPCRTQVEPGAKLTSHGQPVKDPTLYRSLAGALQYLTFTRPDIFNVVQQICIFMHD
ncbi:uncharacterized mitochondrial protein AtMg00810-like [Rutidosis leptorrhynchoides]|uniref:uncharacterized mitochondrial protein AtMg00810-like n=1 Tax=Rutidosis leptorrhynchoides TaxID=125765 RepID=UPI003A991CD0